MPLVLVVAAVNGRHSDRTVNGRSCGPLAARLCVESECLWLFCCAVFLCRRKGAVAIGRHARHGAQLSERLSRKFIETSSSSDCDDNKSEPPSLMSAASMFLQPSPTTSDYSRSDPIIATIHEAFVMASCMASLKFRLYRRVFL